MKAVNGSGVSAEPYPGWFAKAAITKAHRLSGLSKGLPQSQGPGGWTPRRGAGRTRLLPRAGRESGPEAPAGSQPLSSPDFRFVCPRCASASGSKPALGLGTRAPFASGPTAMTSFFFDDPLERPSLQIRSLNLSGDRTF